MLKLQEIMCITRFKNSKNGLLQHKALYERNSAECKDRILYKEREWRVILEQLGKLDGM